MFCQQTLGDVDFMGAWDSPAGPMLGHFEKRPGSQVEAMRHRTLAAEILE